MDILARTLVICQTFYQQDLPQNVLSHFGFLKWKNWLYWKHLYCKPEKNVVYYSVLCCIIETKLTMKFLLLFVISFSLWEHRLSQNIRYQSWVLMVSIEITFSPDHTCKQIFRKKLQFIIVGSYSFLFHVLETRGKQFMENSYITLFISLLSRYVINI